MKFTAYHKIKQFNNIVRGIRFLANKNSQTLPKIMFQGTVKLHGTNASLSYDGENIIAGKRSAFVGGGKDNHFNFDEFVKENEIVLKDMMTQLFFELGLDREKGDILIVYGEWAGEGVQRDVGISKLPKGFYIFDVSVVRDEKIHWFSTRNVNSKNINNVFRIIDFPTYSMEVDFERPGECQNDLVELTNKVEAECPVSKQLGVENALGEGIVWTGYYAGEKFIFKVKGEKHSVTKVKKLASVDPEKIKSIHEFIDYACTENRIIQGIREVDATEKKHMPDLMRWVANDIMSEEQMTLEANGLVWKDVAKDVSNRVRQYYFNILEKQFD